MGLIADQMTRAPPFVTPQDSLATAAHAMMRFGQSMVGVCDHGLCVGTVSVHDIASSVARGSPAATTLVGHLMNAGFSSCFEDEQYQDVLDGRPAPRGTRLPVLDRQGRLVGMLAVP